MALVLDAEAVREEAQARGEDLMAALARYQALGVNGVAFPERLVRDWVGEGVLLYRQGRELVEMGLSARPGWHYLKGDPALLALLERAYDLPSERLGEWLGFPVDVQALPAFYNLEELRQAKAMGLYVMVRPLNHRLRRPEAGLPLVPKEADAVVFLGLRALGYPYRLGEAKALVPVPVALIEGTPQAGLGAFRDQGILRLFSLRYEWLLTLKPEEAAEKYGLAARERSHQILYLRPYPYPEDTARLLKRLQEELKASGLPLGAPSPRALAPSP